MISYVVSAPVVALALGGTFTLVLAIGGDHPLWRAEPLNLSEAAALRDRGEVARLLETGDDPRVTRSVRGGFLYQHPTRLTAVDAAVLADRSEILQILLDSGLTFETAAWQRAWCHATSDDMRELLAGARPPGSPAACLPAAAAPAD